MISMAPTAFVDCTKGSCSLVAPVKPLMMKSWNVLLEMPLQPPLAAPPQAGQVTAGGVGGNPPGQLPAVSCPQFPLVPGPVKGAPGQPLPAVGTHTLPV